ncbi:hypothetical protein DFH09DRAFT_1275556 [Mycena vulgaris]|nr:hypothetical protein DFH09DRAFT_1275556 [Mycena vulgaris]
MGKVRYHEYKYSSSQESHLSCMNAAEYATAIMDELRGWAHGWLVALRTTCALQRILNLPSPHANYSLPPGFPFGDFTLSQLFEWIHEYGTEQLRHTHSVAFILRGRTNGPSSSVAWTLIPEEEQIELGVLEIAGPIYDDGELPFQIDTDLVLEGMMASLCARAPMYLASRTLAAMNPNSPPGAPPHVLRIYELRTPTGTVIRRVGVRWLS